MQNPMPSRLASSNSGCVAAFGIDRSYQWSASVMSSTNQRGKNVVKASSGYTTSSTPCFAAWHKQVDHPGDDLLAAVVALDRPELRGGDGEDS